MADDFDADAAAPVGEVIAQLRAELGLADDGSTPKGGDAPKLKSDAEDEPPVLPAGAKEERVEHGLKDDSDDEGGGTPAPKEVKTADEPSSGLTKILEKYGFDEEKFAEGVINLQNSNARLNDKITALEERLEQLGSDELDPAIAAINTELETVSGDIQANQQRQNALVKKGELLRSEIAEIKGELKSTEDEGKRSRLEAKIETRQETLERHADKWDDIARENKRLVRQISDIETKRKDVEKRIKDLRAEERSTSQTLSTWREAQNTTFNNALKGLSQIYDMTKAEASHLESVIRAETIVELRKNPEEKAMDLVKYVGQRAKVHAAMMKLETKFGKTTKDKAEVTPQKPERGQPQLRKTAQPAAAPRPAKGGRISDAEAAKSADDARAFAAKNLGG